MARLVLQVFGGFAARLGSGHRLRLPRRKAQGLLAYLALPPGRPHSRDQLAALLWGDTGDAQARQSLRHPARPPPHPRPKPPPPILLADHDTLALNPAAVDVDAHAFERLGAEGTPSALEQALALYRGDLLEGLRVTEAAFEE